MLRSVTGVLPGKYSRGNIKGGKKIGVEGKKFEEDKERRERKREKD